MKTRLLSALSVVLLIFTTSCSFTENITINEDGTGSMSLDMDASELMAMAGDEIAKSGEKRVDSTMSFKELLAEKKDSIAKLPQEEQDRLKKLENFSIKMLMDPETQEFKFSLLSDFKKVEDMGDMMDSFDKANPMNSKKPEGAPDFGLDKYKTQSKYAYNGKKFTKTVSRKESLPETKEEGEDTMEMMRGMLESSTYTINYNFPKKVKSVSNKNATISADKKTVTVIYPFTDYMDKPDAMSVEVEFE